MREQLINADKRQLMLKGLAAGALALLLSSGGMFWTGKVSAEALEPKPGKYRPTPPSKEDVEAGKAVYFRKCVWCHGPDGAGDGPSAIRLHPKPRNFNQGTFKIRHTASGELPTDEDLFNTVTHGLPGSVMPPWGEILSDKERRQVISFVKTELVKDRKFDDKDEALNVIDYGKQIASSEDSIKKGREIFMTKAKCVECHGVEGRGNGNLTQRDDWGFPIFPADLQKPWNLRGNRRDPYNPKNIFREISTGLNGTPMPSFADELTPEERWHVANFVMSLSQKFPIDPSTNKPAIQFVIKSKFLKEGELPSDPNDKRWEPLPPQIIGMASQIIQPPRHFLRTVDDLRVRSLFNNKEVAILVEWDDRTESHRDENKQAVYDMTAISSASFPAINTTEYTHENDTEAGPLKDVNPPSKGVYNDGVAIQFAEKWQELPSPEKPYFIHGDVKRGVDLWKWESDGSTKEYEGHGIDSVKVKEGNKNVRVDGAKWNNGRWQLILKRSLTTADKEHDAQLEMGKNIPMVFFAWDGDAGEFAGKMALSTYYYLMLEPPVPGKVYVIPPIIAGIVVILEGCVLYSARKRKRENA
ncbi:MAG: c-type cytochrome [Nitrospirae bacterium]|nr:c-type cytochrome [Candidatus Manganitrophaceae bacterium]